MGKKTAQRQKQKKKKRSLHKKHKERRKKDCVLGMPFIIAFQGDPARTFYCADYPSSFELIPRTDRYPDYAHPFSRLKKYMEHHVTSMHDKVLVYKAGPNIIFALAFLFLVIVYPLLVQIHKRR